MDRESMSPVGSLWERTLCATNQRSSTPRRGGRAQGALPRTSRLANDWRAKADAKRGPALSPQRFGRVAQRFAVPAAYPRRLPHQTRLERSGLSQHDAAGVIRPLLWVTFDAKLVPWDLLGQQKKSDSSGGSRSKRPPRRRHPGGNATTRNRSAGRPALRLLKGASDQSWNDGLRHAARQQAAKQPTLTPFASPPPPHSTPQTQTNC